jgi:predicted Zn-dependent protease
LEFIQTHPLTESRLEVARNALKEQVSIVKNDRLDRIWLEIIEKLPK